MKEGLGEEDWGGRGETEREGGMGVSLKSSNDLLIDEGPKPLTPNYHRA